MYNFILVRSYRPEDEPFCKQLLRASVMNSLHETFIEFFLQKNTMRVINILAIMSMLTLLRTELPEFYCSMVIFIPAIVLYILLYVRFIYEAKVVENEVSSIPGYYILNYFFLFCFILFVCFCYFLFR